MSNNVGKVKKVIFVHGCDYYFCNFHFSDLFQYYSVIQISPTTDVLVGLDTLKLYRRN